MHSVEIKKASAAVLGDFSNLQLIEPELRSKDLPGAVAELCQAMQRGQVIADWLPFYHAVLNREFLASTAAGHGLALPHARLTGVRQPWFALGRSSVPISWGNNPPTPVRLIFLLAIPSTDATGYLNLISGLARLGLNDDALSELMQAREAAAMMDVLRGAPVRSSNFGRR